MTCSACGAPLEPGRGCDRCLLKLALEAPEPDVPELKALASRGRGRLLLAGALGVAVVAVAAFLLLSKPEPPSDPRDSLVGSWKGTYTSDRGAKSQGTLETVILKSKEDPRLIRLSLMLGGRDPLVGVGDFEVIEESGRKVLTMKTFVVRGRDFDGKLRLATLRVGRKLEGAYLIAGTGMNDSGTFEQAPWAP